MMYPIGAFQLVRRGIPKMDGLDVHGKIPWRWMMTALVPPLKRKPQKYHQNMSEFGKTCWESSLDFGRPWEDTQNGVLWMLFSQGQFMRKSCLDWEIAVGWCLISPFNIFPGIWNLKTMSVQRLNITLREMLGVISPPKKSADADTAHAHVTLFRQPYLVTIWNIGIHWVLFDMIMNDYDGMF